LTGSTETEIGMSAKEATARIKINKLFDAVGDNFRKMTRGYIEAGQVSATPNRELIARIKKKIQTSLARIWGKDKLLSLES
jgi:hypothetical protein